MGPERRGWRGLRAPCRGATALAALLATAGAQAEPLPTARLRYTVPAIADGCPSEESFRDLVVARVGRDPFTPDAAALVDASIAADEGSGRLLGRIELFGADGASLGQRALPAPLGACRELVEAMVVPIGIALDPATTPLAPAPAAEPPAAQPAPARAQRAAGVAVTPGVDGGRRPSSPDRSRPVELSLATGARLGATPAAAVRAAVAAGLRFRRWTLAVEAALTDQLGDVQLAGSSTGVTVIEGSIVPCLRLPPLAACLAVSAGVLEVRGQYEQDVVRSPWAEAGPRLRWDLPVSRWLLLRAEAEATVPWLVPSIHVDGRGAWTGGPVTGALSLGAVALP